VAPVISRWSPESMKRLALLVVVAAVYAALFVNLSRHSSRGGFDALSPRARLLEQLIETKRFADARPVADELAAAFPHEPLAAYWKATVLGGLGRRREAAEVWEAYVRMSTTPDEACPAMPEAYASLGEVDKALDAYERCAAFAPSDPERLVDLADAYAHAGRSADALVAYRKASVLDPTNPFVRERVTQADR